jgi:hypothetical protein
MATPRAAGGALARRSAKSAPLLDLVRQDDETEEELRRLVGIRRQLAPQADGRQRLAALLGGQRHFAARRARRGSRVCCAAAIMVMYGPCHWPCLNSSSALVSTAGRRSARPWAAVVLGVRLRVGIRRLRRGGRGRRGLARHRRGGRRLRHGMRGHQADKVTMAKAFFKG